MSESIQLGMRPSGEEGVKAAFLSLDEHAKRVTLRFKEATSAAKDTGKTLQQDVGGKGKQSMESVETSTRKTTQGMNLLGTAIKAALASGVLRQFIVEMDQVTKKMSEAGAIASRTLAATTFASGDIGKSGQIGQALAGVNSPLTFEQRTGIFGAVRGSAPFADQQSILRVTERIAGTGAVAAGMDISNINRLGELSGEFVARGFGPDQATDLATTVLQMSGNQDVKTPAFGLADRLMTDKGMGSKQAMLMGLSAVMTAQRQGIEIPKMGPVDKAMGMLDQNTMGIIQRGLMNSGGALENAAAAALSDPRYATEVSRATASASTTVADAANPAGRRRAAAEATIAQYEARLASEGSTLERTIRGVLNMVGQRQLETAVLSAMQPREQATRVNVSVRSDDPAVSVMGSSD
jgi:hypothetical protein